MLEDLTPWQIEHQPSLFSIHIKHKRSLLRNSTPQKPSPADTSIHLFRLTHQCQAKIRSTFHQSKGQDKNLVARSLQAEKNHKYRLNTLRKHHHRQSMVSVEDNVKFNFTLKELDQLWEKGDRKEIKKERKTKKAMYGKSSFKKYCNVGLLNTLRKPQTPERYSCYQYPTSKSYFCFNRHFI